MYDWCILHTVLGLFPGFYWYEATPYEASSRFPLFDTAACWNGTQSKQQFNLKLTRYFVNMLTMWLLYTYNPWYVQQYRKSTRRKNEYDHESNESINERMDTWRAIQKISRVIFRRPNIYSWYSGSKTKTTLPWKSSWCFMDKTQSTARGARF